MCAKMIGPDARVTRDEALALNSPRRTPAGHSWQSNAVRGAGSLWKYETKRQTGLVGFSKPHVVSL